MKALTTLMMTVLMVLGATLYIKEDPFTDGRYRIYDSKWRCVGYLIENRLDKNRIDIFNKKWERTGRIEKNQDMWDVKKVD